MKTVWFSLQPSLLSENVFQVNYQEEKKSGSIAFANSVHLLDARCFQQAQIVCGKNM
jgi:hypothetical protein